MNARRSITQVFASVTFGFVALVIVFAILTGAIVAVQVAGDLQHATAQLNDIRKADAKAEQARVKRSAQVQARLDGLQRHAQQQSAADQVQRRYLALMARELRSHGIPVPPPPRVTVTASPKGPRRSHPAGPGHTAHGPRSPSGTPSPSSNMACSLVSTLCPFLTLP